MAWLERDPSGFYHVAFRFGNRKFKRSLRTKHKRAAEAVCLRLDENIHLAHRGRLEIPTGVIPKCVNGLLALLSRNWYRRISRDA